LGCPHGGLFLCATPTVPERGPKLCFLGNRFCLQSALPRIFSVLRVLHTHGLCVTESSLLPQLQIPPVCVFFSFPATLVHYSPLFSPFLPPPPPYPAQETYQPITSPLHVKVSLARIFLGRLSRVRPSPCRSSSATSFGQLFLPFYFPVPGMRPMPQLSFCDVNPFPVHLFDVAATSADFPPIPDFCYQSLTG